MSSTHTPDPYTDPSAGELRAALAAGATPADHSTLAKLAWCQDRFGFAIAEAGRGGPLDRSAVYTVGLGAHGHPEFVVIGQPPETAHLVLSSLARRLVHSEHFSVEVVGACELEEYGEVMVLCVRVEDEFSAGRGAQGLTVNLFELPLDVEDALFPGGLYRHPADDERTVMMHVVLPDTPVLSRAEAATPAEDPEREDDPDLQEVPRPLSEIVRAEGRLTDRVWYYRSVEHEMALVERGYVCQEHGRDCELEALRQEWAPGRRRIEATFTEPGDLGPITEFELGVLHGKLSALRWVIGRHWDFLDLS